MHFVNTADRGMGNHYLTPSIGNGMLCVEQSSCNLNQLAYVSEVYELIDSPFFGFLKHETHIVSCLNNLFLFNTQTFQSQFFTDVSRYKYQFTDIGCQCNINLSDDGILICIAGH